MSRILYISARCEYCIRLLKGIQEYSFLKDIFHIVNIDNTSFPNNITTVPSAIINNQLIEGETVFEYLGKIVESKNQQQTNNQQSFNQPQCSAQPQTNQDQCRINENGELEGYCCDGLNCSIISDNNDNCAENFYGNHSTYELLESFGDIKDNIKDMEIADKTIKDTKSGFDSDYERLQRERGELLKK